MADSFKYVFGPVHSWRLGRSLGIDPLSLEKKICNMDCIYCQLGRSSQLAHDREVFIPTQEVLDELKQIPLNSVDHITFSGRGEPTLALNLGEMIRAVKVIRPEKVAVITNSSLMNREEVRHDLMAADYVLAKLDAGNQMDFEMVDQGQTLDLSKIIQGISDFRKVFKGRLALQIMLVDDNIKNVEEIAKVSRQIKADEVQLDTPLRPSGVQPLSKERIFWAKEYFKDMTVVTVYDLPLQDYSPMDDKATQRRHGNYKKRL
ncbi:MAG: radical SAM protein [Candidatus Omnitrophica bacterium]|nr:radical SAM protein [Candidatus Omnitrophota bacterium]